MPTRPRIAAFAAALVGLAVFAAAGLPLPFLLGPMFGCLAAALSGVRLAGPAKAAGVFRAVLGVAVGASITPELLGRLDQMAASVALIPLTVVAAGVLGVPYFTRLCGFDRPTAYFSAMPGGLQDMIMLGREAGADMRAIALVHVTRVLVIVALMPAILEWGWGLSLDRPPGAPAAEIPPWELGLMLLAGWVGWGYAARVGLFGASILGPMAAAAALSLSGELTHRPPLEAILAAQFFIGLIVGAGYDGVTGRELRRVVAAALGFCVVLAALALAFAEGALRLGVAPRVDALLAFAPGGQAEMAVLAIVAGADVAYVVTHHLARLIVVILGAPLAARGMRGA